MATESRRQGTAVIDRLLQEPEAFEFFQAIRILEWAAQRNDDKSGDTISVSAQPLRDFARFRAHASLAFPSADIQKISRRPLPGALPDDPARQFQVTTSVLTLLGATGVLPFHYTEQVLERLKFKDSSMKDFFDLFNHRALTLFYQAWCKYHLPVQFERGRRVTTLKHRSTDTFTQVLSSLAGMGTPHLRDRHTVPDDSLLGFTSYLMSQSRSAANLEALLHHQFGLRFRVVQFVGQWQRLVPDVLTRLPSKESKGMNHSLGRNAFVGSRCWHTQGKFRVEVEDVAYDQFMTFAPGTAKMRALQETIRAYAGMELDFEINLSVRKEEIPPIQLTHQRSVMGLLGWNTRLPGRQDASERISVRVSARYC